MYNVSQYNISVFIKKKKKSTIPMIKKLKSL